MKKQISIFDTTLRDGSQGEKVSFSLEDKLRIARRLDSFGIDYIEGGWPGSNPKDLLFFKRIRDEKLENTRIVAFGSTMRSDKLPADDPNLQALIAAATPTVSIFGKSWLLHVQKALRVTPDENLRLIRESLLYLKQNGKELIYDAEHFFDGYKHDPDYALETLLAAQEGGADVLVLCDTNGGTLPTELAQIICDIKSSLALPLGIHAHNDSEVAVANSLVAVENGCVHVQGTINGLGERCGNANLCSIIANLQIKRDYHCVPANKLAELTSVSRFVSEVANLSHAHNSAFVGKSAFAHKGGVHVSAVMKDAATYEHITPESVGNQRRVLISDLSGRSNIFYKAEELNVNLKAHPEKAHEIVRELKERENRGYQYEAAEGSVKLLIQRVLGEWQDYFQLEGFRVTVEKNATGETRSEASIRVNVNGSVEHTAAEGSGPVEALDQALRKALVKFFPEVEEIQLSDYKVRVLNEKDGTGAKVRVLIDSSADGASWGTVGVSDNIIEASWQALMEGISYFLMQREQEQNNVTTVPESAATLATS